MFFPGGTFNFKCPSHRTSSQFAVLSSKVVSWRVFWEYPQCKSLIFTTVVFVFHTVFSCNHLLNKIQLHPFDCSFQPLIWLVVSLYRLTSTYRFWLCQSCTTVSVHMISRNRTLQRTCPNILKIVSFECSFQVAPPNFVRGAIIDGVNMLRESFPLFTSDSRKRSMLYLTGDF